MNHFLPFLVSTPAENLKLHRTFVQWMEEHANFRDICDEGKGENKNKNKKGKQSLDQISLDIFTWSNFSIKRLKINQLIELFDQLIKKNWHILAVDRIFY